MNDQGQRRWDAIPPQTRDDVIGHLIEARPSTQCMVYFGTAKVLVTSYTESTRAEAEKLVQDFRTDDKLWSHIKAKHPHLSNVMRPELKVVVERWHMRYSDTPGGGWEVVEWIRREVGSVEVCSSAKGWKVSAIDYAGSAPTMAEAACICALSIKSVESVPSVSGSSSSPNFNLQTPISDSSPSPLPKGACEDGGQGGVP